MHYLSDIFVGRQNNLTFIRLMAAFSVIYGHSYAILPGHGGDWVARTTGYAFAGGVAVDIFFLISGFLVTGSILRSGMKRYLASRFLRIYPALWLNLFLVTFLLGTAATNLPISDYLTRREVWTYFLGLSGTYQGAFFLPGVFSTNGDHAVNGAIWSVLLEVRLYVIVSVAYLAGIFRSRALFNMLFFIAIVAIWSNATWVPSFMAGKTNLHVCLMFYIGSFLYVNKDMVPVSPYYMLVALFLAGMMLGSDKFPFAYILLLVTFFCSASFYSQFSWLDRFGDYSYGVYLYGWPAQQVVALNFPAMLPLQNTLLSCGLALMCGMFSWHYIEKPSLSLKRFFDLKNSKDPAQAQ